MTRKYGFDLDGTADLPAIRDLANDLYDAGHEIYIITGEMADTGEWTIEARIAKCRSLGLKYTEIVRCFGGSLHEIAEVKRAECAERGICLMFEDSHIYAASTRLACQTLLVV